MQKILIKVGVVVSVVGATTYFIYRRFYRDLPPSLWRCVGTLEQINIFPIKSCGPLKLKPNDIVQCDELGPHIEGVRDRSFMIIDKNGDFVTARRYPRLLLISPKLTTQKTLSVSAPGMPDLEMDLLKFLTDQNINVVVWGVKLTAKLCTDDLNSWFSQFILNDDVGLKIVYYPHTKPVRQTNSRLIKQPFIKQKDSGTFGDATSYMLMNLSSVADLNKRLQSPISSLQFRGNFEIKLHIDQPYTEDNWKWIRLGHDAMFRNVAPCTRCILPNINTATGERDTAGEPLKTLRSYRLFDFASPAMGIHLGLRSPGEIKANCKVYIEDH